ncbi:hypothetical protein Vretimale_1815, partial [Volvox reticuliferus]
GNGRGAPQLPPAARTSGAVAATSASAASEVVRGSGPRGGSLPAQLAGYFTPGVAALHPVGCPAAAFLSPRPTPGTLPGNTGAAAAAANQTITGANPSTEGSADGVSGTGAEAPAVPSAPPASVAVTVHMTTETPAVAAAGGGETTTQQAPLLNGVDEIASAAVVRGADGGARRGPGRPSKQPREGRGRGRGNAQGHSKLVSAQHESTPSSQSPSGRDDPAARLALVAHSGQPEAVVDADQHSNGEHQGDARADRNGGATATGAAHSPGSRCANGPQSLPQPPLVEHVQLESEPRKATVTHRTTTGSAVPMKDQTLAENHPREDMGAARETVAIGEPRRSRRGARYSRATATEHAGADREQLHPSSPFFRSEDHNDNVAAAAAATGNADVREGDHGHDRDHSAAALTPPPKRRRLMQIDAAGALVPAAKASHVSFANESEGAVGDAADGGPTRPQPSTRGRRSAVVTAVGAATPRPLRRRPTGRHVVLADESDNDEENMEQAPEESQHPRTRSHGAQAIVLRGDGTVAAASGGINANGSGGGGGSGDQHRGGDTGTQRAAAKRAAAEPQGVLPALTPSRARRAGGGGVVSKRARTAAVVAKEPEIEEATEPTSAMGAAEGPLAAATAEAAAADATPLDSVAAIPNSTAVAAGQGRRGDAAMGGRRRREVRVGKGDVEDRRKGTANAASDGDHGEGEEQGRPAKSRRTRRMAAGAAARRGAAGASKLLSEPVPTLAHEVQGASSYTLPQLESELAPHQQGGQGSPLLQREKQPHQEHQDQLRSTEAAGSAAAAAAGQGHEEQEQEAPQRQEILLPVLALTGILQNKQPPQQNPATVHAASNGLAFTVPDGDLELQHHPHPLRPQGCQHQEEQGLQVLQRTVMELQAGITAQAAALADLQVQAAAAQARMAEAETRATAAEVRATAAETRAGAAERRVQEAQQRSRELEERVEHLEAARGQFEARLAESDKRAQDYTSFVAAVAMAVASARERGFLISQDGERDQQQELGAPVPLEVAMGIAVSAPEAAGPSNTSRAQPSHGAAIAGGIASGGRGRHRMGGAVRGAGVAAGGSAAEDAT